MNKKSFVTAFLAAVCSFPVVTALAGAIPNQAMSDYESALHSIKSSPNAAIVDLKRAISLDKTWEAPYNTLGWTYYSLKDFPQATSVFSREYRRFNSEQAAWGLANVYSNSQVREFANARKYLVISEGSAVYRPNAEKLLSHLPPNQLDLTVNSNRPISYEDAIDYILTYNSAVTGTPSDYLQWALSHQKLADISLPKDLKAPATRMFVAQYLSRYYGLDQFEYNRPFPLTDVKTLSVENQMIINSVLANRLMAEPTPNTFHPLGTVSRGEYAKIIENANRIMSHPLNPSHWLSPPAPPAQVPFLYFFAGGRTGELQDMTKHIQQISAIGFTTYPFISDFPQGAAKIRQQIDGTKYLLTALSAGANVVSELNLVQDSHKDSFMVVGDYNSVTNRPDPGLVNSILSSPTTTAAVIAEIKSIALREKLTGITMDFENIEPADRNEYVNFMAELHQALQGTGLKLMVCLPEQDQSNPNSAYDYAGLAANADLVMLITYDEHTSAGSPGTVAQYAHVKRVIQYAIQQMSPDKVLLGIADYGYDWANGTGIQIGMGTAEALAQAHHSRIVFDKSSETPTFTYVGSNHVSHTVWFENGRSLSLLDGLIHNFGLKGAAIWRLGLENQQLWTALQ